MEMFPVIILNLTTLLPSIFTKLCLPDPPMWSYVIALRNVCNPNVTKCFGCQDVQTKQSVSRMSKESYNCWEDLIGERMETWRRGHSQMNIFIYPKNAWRNRILINHIVSLLSYWFKGIFASWITVEDTNMMNYTCTYMEWLLWQLINA